MNILHIIIAIVLFQIIGFIWYGPLFGKVWSAIIGMPMHDMSPEEKKAFQKRMIPTYVLNLVSSIVYILAYGLFLYASLLTSLGLALILFVGFILPLLAQNALWSGKSRRAQWQMFGIQAGYQLLAIAVLWLLFS